jgi:D-alanyl-D-alanine carboxypeptidase (penicillin-binding protein 5/6)
LSGERPLVSVPLKSAAAVEVGTLRQRAWDALIELMFFWI